MEKQIKKQMNKWFTPQFGNIFKITGFVYNCQNPFEKRVVVENIKGKIFYMTQENVISLLKTSKVA